MSEIFTSISRIGVILVVGSILVSGILHGDALALAGAFVPYWIMQPVFWNILQVGAACLACPSLPASSAKAKAEPCFHPIVPLLTARHCGTASWLRASSACLAAYGRGIATSAGECVLQHG